MRKIISSYLSLFFVAAFFLSGGCAEKLKSSPDQKVLAEFTIEKDVKPILLPVKFQGEEYQFVLDTGCTDVVFDVSLKDKLGRRFLWPKKGQATHGESIKVEYFPAPETQLGPLSLKGSMLVAVTDFNQISPHLPEKADGIIGMDFLKKYAVQIDFDNSKLRFFESKPSLDILWFLRPETNEHPEWGEPMPMQLGFFRDRPHIKGRILDRTQVKFLVDTGWMGHGALESKIFKAVRLKKCEERLQALTAAGKKLPFDVNKLTLVDKLAVASFEYHDVPFSKSNQSILGVRFLSRHVVTFDFPNGKMYLKKGKRFDQPSDFHVGLENLGFVLHRKGNHILVVSVDPDGPAQAKGIRPDDMLLKIDYHDLKSYTLAELIEFFCQMDKKEEHEVITFTVKRGNDTKQISFGESDMVSEHNETD